MTSVDTAASASECPPAEQLACFLDGSLPPAAIADLETHLSTCDRCCSIVADLSQGLDAPDGE
jgi:anti-sigma factor RsiW